MTACRIHVPLSCSLYCSFYFRNVSWHTAVPKTQFFPLLFHICVNLFPFFLPPQFSVYVSIASLLVGCLWAGTLCLCLHGSKLTQIKSCASAGFVCEVFGCRCVCGLAVVPGCGTQRSRGADLPWGLNLVRRGEERGEILRHTQTNTPKHTQSLKSFSSTTVFF